MDKKYLDSLIRVMKDGNPRLYTLELALTNKCNLNCISCIGRGKNPYMPKDEISDKDWIITVKEAIKMNIKEVFIKGGGEALTRLKLFESLIILIKNNNIKTHLQTNGTLFNETIIKKIVKIGFDCLDISIDGPDAKTNDYLRGVKGTFDRIMNNIKNFNYWKKKFNVAYPSLNFHPVLSSKNYDKICKFVILAKRLKINSIKIQPLVVPLESKIGQILILTNEQKLKFQNHIKKAIGLAKKEKIENNFEQLIPEIINKSHSLGDVIEEDIKNDRYEISSSYFKNNLLKAPCFNPWTFMGIEADGQIKLCPMEPKENNSFNVKMDPIKKVWLNKRYRQLRNKFLIGKQMNYCWNCCGAQVLEVRRIKGEIRQQIYRENNVNGN